MDLLLSYYQQYMAFANSNPIFGSAVFMSVFGGLLMLLKDKLLLIPSTIWRYVSRLLYSEIIIRSDTRWSDSDAFMYDAFLCWYSTTSFYKRFVRSFRMSAQWVDGRRVYIQQAGLGSHWFVYKGRLGVVTLWEERNQNTIYRYMKIRYFGPGALLSKLREDSHSFLEKIQTSNRLSVYEATGEDWNRVSSIRTRDLDSVILADNTLEEITSKIDKFLASEQWYIDRGIPYKLTIVLEGPPGTGKTSLIRALASKYKRSLYKADMSAVCRHLKTVGEDALVYVEDFDTDVATHRRALTKTVKTSQTAEEVVSEETATESTNALDSAVRSFIGEGLSDMLNAMDGMLTPHGLLMILSTNHIEKIDPALIRDERVDAIVHIGLLQHADICRYISRHYSGFVVPEHVTFKPIAGSKLQRFLKANDTADGFVAAILEYQSKAPELKRVV